MSTALASGLPYEDAARIANVAAGIVVEQVGTSAVTIEKLITILNRTADSSL
jgi:D-beta-D-heptose 7-phosphate kinase/D-beta-D-heptose 1-phosphate adenosyltransferase